MNELYNLYRPKAFKHVVGQERALKTVKSLFRKNFPHAICLQGPSGVGKTTLARIIAGKLGCSETDYKEQNAASARGVDTIREIESKMMLSPMHGDCRVFYFDEAHRLTNDAQSALLKMLEDAPKHVYFMLATTDPQKLIPTIRTRCTAIVLGSVDDDEMMKAVRRVIKLDKLEVSDDVCEKIIEHADGSVRRALVSLEAVAGLKTEDEQLEAVEREDERRDAIGLCRILMGHGPKSAANWGNVAAYIKGIPENELESFRRMVLSYATSCAIGAKDKAPPSTFNAGAYKVIVAFSTDWFSTGRAGLVAACAEVLYGD